jgi:uncharacterized protein YoxC
MRTYAFPILLCGVLVIAGCSDKEKERQLQAQLDEAKNQRNSMEVQINEREKFVEDILKSVNEIYADLEKTRTREGKLIQRSAGEGETPWADNPDSRASALNNIGEIGNTLKENRKRISGLQARVRTYGGEVRNLNALLEQLRVSLQERETAIAQLQGEVQGLEQTVQQQTQLVGEREKTIADQRRKMNTGFYVAGTRDELEEKGIITEEGGFLWGLLGSTTTVTADADLGIFTPIDKTETPTIKAPGDVEDILARRSPVPDEAAEAGEDLTEIRILQPDKFWSAPLVVVLD